MIKGVININGKETTYEREAISEECESLDKSYGIEMSEQQDWAEKIAIQILKDIMEFSPVYNNRARDELIKLISEALKKEREIAKLESNKAINFPSEIPDEKFIDVRDERCELVRFVEYEWMKQTIRALSE